jgi:hypothetical protein
LSSANPTGLSPPETKIAKRYIAAASQHGACSETGDYKVGNAAYDRMTKAQQDLKKLPDRGVAVLMKLIEHPNDWVKSAAGAHLLALREELACAVLERLAAGSSRHVAYDAKLVLREWRAGHLTNIRQLGE